MIYRYEPVSYLPIGGQTLGEMMEHADGRYVYHSDYTKLKKDLIEARAALKLIAESPDRCAHAIAEMALLNSKPSGREEEVITPKDTPQ